MWARGSEIVLAGWLALSPLVYGLAVASTWLKVNAWACAIAVASFACISLWPRMGKLHLLNGVVALWLIGLGFFPTSSAPNPMQQNLILAGLVLAMFAIIPTRATRIPAAWERYYDQRPGDQADSPGRAKAT